MGVLGILSGFLAGSLISWSVCSCRYEKHEDKFMENLSENLKDYEKSAADAFFARVNRTLGVELNLDLKLKKSREFTKKALYGGTQYFFNFKNECSVSVIKHFGSYGARHNLWEIAILFKNDFVANLPLSCIKVIANPIVGFLTDEQVEAVLDEIEAMTTTQETSEVQDAK